MSVWKGFEKPPQCVRCHLFAPDLCFVRASGPTCPKPSRCDQVVDHFTRLEHDWIKEQEKRRLSAAVRVVDWAAA